MPASDWRTATYAQLEQRLSALLGEKTAKQLAALGLETAGDLMAHVPRRWFSGAEVSDLGTLRPGEEAAVVARVVDVTVHDRTTPQRLEAVVSDGRGRLSLTFFARKPGMLPYWRGLLTEGSRGIFAGKIGQFRDTLQLAHPLFVIIDDDGSLRGSRKNREIADVIAGGIIGLYPATKQLPTWQIARCAQLVLDQLDLDEPWPEWVRSEADVIGLREAYEAVHRPVDRTVTTQGVDRLRFDEAFITQLTMAHRRALAAGRHAVARPRRDDGILAAFDARLPFELTGGQHRVGEEIFADLGVEQPMQRLLQGEVGSGKTLVALRAMLAVIDNGGQAAFLAPTEVLANQHARSLQAVLGDLAEGGTLASAEHATSVVCLTGSLPAAAKRDLRARIASAEAGIVVGTHALLSEGVDFADLGLVVIDEQHRFGVEQRAALTGKATTHPHVLVMTATPIPRTVAMTVFGDLVTSTLTEIPAGRSDVSTVVVPEKLKPGWIDRAWARVIEEVGHGRQAFVVCPRIGPPATGGGTADDEAEGRGVEQLYAELSAGPLADLRVGMLHGRLPTERKDATMAAFAAGELDVIVATTVIEVGVDVPNASVMIISDADRFGISQLHQLRGRIGRGAHPGVCLLLTRVESETPAAERLRAVASTRDGFVLAEVDLEQRREGDVLGATQSGGRSGLRLLRVLEHADVIDQARTLAERAVIEDPQLTVPGFADAVRRTEVLAQDEWLDRN